jgi:hypothetical protein
MISLDIPWDIPTAELNAPLRAAGVEPGSQDDRTLRAARNLDLQTRMALVTALRESVRRARVDAPPVERWLTASQSLFMDDNGSEAARQREDAFWQNLTCIVNGCLAQILLGDLSEFPFFIGLLEHQPAGHLIEMATDVLRHYVDPSGELDTPQLIRRAEEWWQSFSSTNTLTGAGGTKKHE